MSPSISADEWQEITNKITMFNEESYFVRQRDVNDDKKINKRKTIPRFQNEIPRLIFYFFYSSHKIDIQWHKTRRCPCDVSVGFLLFVFVSRLLICHWHVQRGRRRLNRSQPNSLGLRIFFPRTNLVQLADISAWGCFESRVTKHSIRYGHF